MLSVIVPAYRSAGIISETLDVLQATLERLERPYEIILVPDGNLDDTATRVAADHADVRICAYEEHRGKGYAIRHGIANADGDLIAYIDADLELHPDGLLGLVALIDDGADIALGSKRHPDSDIHYPAFRRLQSALYQWFVRLLFGLRVTDTQTGLKVFRGDPLRAVAPSLTSDGFAIDLELLVVLSEQGATVAEGPVSLDYRFNTTIRARDIVGVLRETFRIYRSRRRLQRAGRRSRHTSGSGVRDDRR